MGLTNIVDKKLIEETIRESPRGRAVNVLHPPEKEGIRILVNAIQPGSYIQPHFHETEEIWVILTGELEALLFNE